VNEATDNIFTRAELAYRAALDLNRDVQNFVAAMRDILDGYFRDAHCGLYGAGMTEADPAESPYVSMFDERPEAIGVLEKRVEPAQPSLFDEVQP
jgi:hypothetical protein